MRKWTHRCPRQPHYASPGSPGSSSFRNISSIWPQSDRVWPGDRHCFWPLGSVSLLAVRICDKHTKMKTKTVGKQEERKEEWAGKAGEGRRKGKSRAWCRRHDSMGIWPRPPWDRPLRIEEMLGFCLTIWKKRGQECSGTFFNPVI